MKCPTCGTENDAANRFCDQCGTRLEPSGAFAQAQEAIASQPTAAAPTCPSCGAVVLPGEAFCDECGATLTSAAPVPAVGAYDAPTMLAPPPASSSEPGGGDQSNVCPACGHQNLPGDRFCDNCGAALGTQPAATAGPAPVIADAPTIVSPVEIPITVSPPEAEPPPPSAPVQEPPTETAPPVETPPAEPPQPQEAPPAEAPSPDKAPTVEQPALQVDTSAQADYEAEQKRLNEEIARQQQIITQFEQMESMFGAATPPAVKQGLADARDARARAEAELAALQPPAPPAPPVDPAEVARLNEEIARQQQIITQFEQMESMFGAATPPAVKQGLADARDARARAEAELAALGGVAAPSVSAAPPEASAAPAPQPEASAAPAPQPEPPATPPTATIQVDDANAPTVLAPSPTAGAPEPVPSAPPPVPSTPAPSAASTPSVPRLVIDDGNKELPLPLDKPEIIIGREDPISGIFPEIDLTAYGGESGGVSRQHARISRINSQWTITDLNSTNYTRVDGTKLNPSVPVPIKDGAKLQFGRVAVTFHE